MRGLRREAVDEVEMLEEAKEFSEDEAFSRKKKIDEEVKQTNQQIVELAEEKKALGRVHGKSKNVVNVQSLDFDKIVDTNRSKLCLLGV